MHVVIRADGGPEIGYGHLVRSSALARAVLEDGHTVTFATTTPDHVREVCPASVRTARLPARGDPEPFVHWLDSASVDVVFSDAYPVTVEYQRAVRDIVPLAVWQDEARNAVCADAFFNGNLYAESLEYEFVGPRPSICLGTDYVLLRTEFTKLAARKPPWREDPERAIVTMGGSDVANHTPDVIRSFDGMDIRVDAIVGPGFSERQATEIHSAADTVSSDIRVVRDPPNLADRMFQADFAVSTASTTTYELLALGTPLVCLPVAENQEPIACALKEQGAGLVLEDGGGVDAFRRAVQKYHSMTSFRRARLEAGRELVDGRGVARVYDEIISLVGSNPTV
ncbi:UDP-2,4-diacetamido-2,4,6-trideoxy-beta-L-altropyranose hydrolase [Haloarculaceae archaeon H-GB2-1]|nr:UDP-2,4-diacetamido-2,4,6-trideoxy-beta-L-altropyranose hydrolase [Haloarculaceae archaeon H-GB1-1]MEA5388495.1 UDP-2,4-diacetamido-2,4,6-trideoxy-beta-L-altropyranose hydrolase [Haloarculaceae archaeon H-GB11]MEA5406527.1 UDP-2,4-diacetamido-2,4,6-trideoxy-beta-L-altropyranose hydrolase [Haloarculaceae archaeon H-GB2-1]